MRIAVAVLAGGRSTRMGREKALLQVGARAGQTLLARQFALLETLRPAERILSVRTGQACPGFAGIKVVRDDGTAGPIGGVLAALRACRAPAVFVLGVDLGAILPTTVRKLAAISALEDGIGVIPRTEGGCIEPLAAVYSRALVPIAEVQVRDGADLSMQALARSGVIAGLLRWYDIPVFEEPEFANWNRPADVRRTG